ncbi:MAG: endonuclease V [Bacteroidota bacterium]
MIYAFDAYYTDEVVRTAVIGFDTWTSSDVVLEQVKFSAPAGAYVSGQFYQRELPGLLALISQLPLHQGDILLIDGYVYLNNEGRNGLGGYLHEALDGRFPVVGIAKKHFKTLTDNVLPVYRGKSQKPLYVTARGVDLATVAVGLSHMVGPYRIPSLLKRVDQLSRA